MNRFGIRAARVTVAIALSLGLLQGGCHNGDCDPCCRVAPPCCPPPANQYQAAAKSLPTFPFTHWKLDDDTDNYANVSSEVAATLGTISLMNGNMAFIGSRDNSNLICSPAVAGTCLSTWNYSKPMTSYEFSGVYFVKLNLAVTVGGTTGPSISTGNLGVHMNASDLPLNGAQFVIYSASVTNSTTANYVVYYRLRYYPSAVTLMTPVWESNDPDYRRWTQLSLTAP